MAKKKQELTSEELLAEALVREEDWPYEVPGNWVWVRLGSVASIIGGGTPSSNVSEYYENGNIPWISPADLSHYTDIYISHGRKNITELGLKKSSARLMPPNTVMLSSRAPIGYVVIAENEIATNQGFKSFLPSSCYLPKYLYFYLKNNKELLESYASGTTFLELSGRNAALVEFPLPPLAEQQRIVDRVESLFDKLDQAKDLLQEALDSFENRKAAILHQAFTGELTKKWREEHGVGIESWETKSIDDLFKVFSGKGFKEREYADQGIKLLRISNVSYNSLDWKDTKFLPLNYLETENSLVLDVNDIVIALNRPITNNQLKVSLVDDNKYILYQRVGCLRLLTATYISKYFLYYFLSKEFRIKIENNLQGSDQPYINLPPLKKLMCPVCTLFEQQEIVRILDDLFEKEQNAKELYDLIDQIEAMKKSILGQAFRGKLGTNEAGEESAVELLKDVVL